MNFSLAISSTTMIKLRTLVNEALHNQRPDKSFDELLLKTRLHTWSGTVYHGSPPDGVENMLTQGIYGTQHGEIADYDTFSTSINESVLRLFSDGHGITGVEFDVKNINLLVVDDFTHKLLVELPGSGMDVDWIDEDQFMLFCKKFNIPFDGREFYLPYNYLSDLGIDAFVFDYTWKRMDRGHGYLHNDESEICFVKNGINKLEGFLTHIFVDSDVFEANQKKEAILHIRAND